VVAQTERMPLLAELLNLVVLVVVDHTIPVLILLIMEVRLLEHLGTLEQQM
tara:strand:- start:1135 stop:1287 length:153 start_codon:yes stop_codon:yes gene_type:complete